MKLDKNTLRKIYFVFCAVLIIAFFIPAFQIKFEMFGTGTGYSMSFADMTFGGDPIMGEGEITNIIFLLIPAGLIGLAFFKWKYSKILIYILAAVGFLLLFIYMDGTVSFALGYWLTFIGYIGAIASHTMYLKIGESNIPSDSTYLQTRTTMPMRTVICPMCGAQLPENSKFCDKCGTKIEKKIGGELVCPNCGAQCKPDDRFCEKCGKNLQE